MTTPVLSVVVIGRNEGARLERCLESIAHLRGLAGPIEVIYVDSNSSDGSPGRARAAGAQVIEVRPAHPTAAIGRNAGWQAASAPFVLFLDGDTQVHPDFAATALESLVDPSVAIVWGHRRETKPADSVYNRILDLDWIYPPGESEFCGGDALMRREALEEAGGYDETLIAGEEPEMCRRLRGKRYRILHIDTPMTGHDLAITRWPQYWKRALRAGYAYAQVSERFRGTGDPFWESDRRRNVIRGSFWLALPFAAFAAAMAMRSGWPVYAALGLIAALTLRSAWRARWKSSGPGTLILYGLHSHLQQVPILLGQWQFARDRRKGLQRGLIDYKEAAR
jgi:glycosyltransferase involved in cell wall biosynthesis